MRYLRVFCFLCCTSICLPAAQAAEDDFIIIGTGGVTGVYYPTGGSICRMVNRYRDEHGVRCAVESTQGSVYNITHLRSGDLDMAVVQADIQEHAYRGIEEFKEAGAFNELRMLFLLHDEAFTLVARKGAGIKALADLKGMRVNIGNQGSGQRATMDQLMQALRWDYDDFLNTFEYTSSEQAAALCRGRFDAMVFVVGHPSGSIKDATAHCDSVLVDVSGPAVSSLLERYPYYRKVTIPGGLYRGNEAAVSSFGLAATFVTSARVAEHIVYDVVKSIFENLETFNRLHPAFHNLQREAMVRSKLAPPLHAGALKYYKEAGLL